LKALQLLWQGTFDLVLLADKLDMNGEEVVRQVRSGRTGTPVVVMQSVPPSDDLAVRYARLGACSFVSLPGLGESAAALQNLSEDRTASAAAGRAAYRGGSALRDLRTSTLVADRFGP
jgi:DNA-binding response OmpR family regulator